MKLFVPLRKHTVPLACMAILASSTGLLSFSKAKKQDSHLVYLHALPSDTIRIQKQTISRKYKIKLYPNANHEVLFFNASGGSRQGFQLYIFNLDGEMVKQALIRDKETVVIDHIDRGDYLFEVFSDDERIENGQMMVR